MTGRGVWVQFWRWLPFPCPTSARRLQFCTDEDFQSVREIEELGLDGGWEMTAVPSPVSPSQYHKRDFSVCSLVFPMSVWWRKSQKRVKPSLCLWHSPVSPHLTSNSLQVSSWNFLLVYMALGGVPHKQMLRPYFFLKVTFSHLILC